MTQQKEQSDSLEFLGFSAGTLECIALLPLIHKTYKTKSSKDLSTHTIIIMYIALIMAIIYGFLINHFAVYFTNILTIFLYVILHGIKIKNEHFTSSSSSSSSIAYQELTEVTVVQ
jgi:MtN3 and saliva related transmembrane protein